MPALVLPPGVRIGSNVSLCGAHKKRVLQCSRGDGGQLRHAAVGDLNQIITPTVANVFIFIHFD